MIDEQRLAEITRRHDKGPGRGVEGDWTVMELVAQARADRTEIDGFKGDCASLSAQWVVKEGERAECSAEVKRLRAEYEELKDDHERDFKTLVKERDSLRAEVARLSRWKEAAQALGYQHRGESSE